MKKILGIVIAAILLNTGEASAQATKIGYIRIDDIVNVMPELRGVNMDTVGTKFITDSIQPEFEKLQIKYQNKLEEFSRYKTNSIADSIAKEKIRREMDTVQAQLQGAQDYVQRLVQYKQQEFLAPFYKKAKDAIVAVAKKKGYTHVVSTDILVYALPADDISLAVLAELKIELPKQPGQQPKPNTGGARPPGRQ